MRGEADAGPGSTRPGTRGAGACPFLAAPWSPGFAWKGAVPPGRPRAARRPGALCSQVAWRRPGQREEKDPKAVGSG